MKLMAVAVLALAVAGPSIDQAQSTPPPPQQTPARRPDVIWLPTDEVVVAAMLKLANVTKEDVVYDLGCGDGRIVIAAAKLGARGVGIDIDPDRIKDATAAAKKAGVADRVKFIEGDLFDPAIRISDATVVTLYLLPSLNARLMPRLKNELKPGTRIVSNAFSMGDAWPPDQTQQVGDSVIYSWIR